MSAKAALELVSTDDPPAEEPQQLDLIGGLQPDQLEKRAAQPRGPGRPPGARNKRTEEWANFLLAQYASPLEVLAQIYSARVEDLQERLGCTRFEAAQEKRLAAIAAIPFLHSKLPLAVDLNKTSHVVLTIVDAEPEASTGEDLTLTARVIEAVERDDAES